MSHGFEAPTKDWVPQQTDWAQLSALSRESVQEEEDQSVPCTNAQEASGCCALSVPACQQRVSELVAVAVRESFERYVSVLRADLAKQWVAEPGKSLLEEESICAELAGMRAELAEQGRRVRQLEDILLSSTGTLRDSADSPKAIGQRRTELNLRLQKLEDSVANLGTGGISSNGTTSSTLPTENKLAKRIQGLETKSTDTNDVVIEGTPATLALASKPERPQVPVSSSSSPVNFTSGSWMRATQPAAHPTMTWTRPAAPSLAPTSLTPMPQAGAFLCDNGALASPTLRQQVAKSYESWTNARPAIVQRSLSASLPVLAASSRTASRTGPGLAVTCSEADGRPQSISPTISPKVSSPASSLQHEKARPRSVARTPVPAVDTSSPINAGGDSSGRQSLGALSHRTPTGLSARAAGMPSARSQVSARMGAPRQSLSPESGASTSQSP